MSEELNFDKQIWMELIAITDRTLCSMASTRSAARNLLSFAQLKIPRYQQIVILDWGAKQFTTAEASCNEIRNKHFLN